MDIVASDIQVWNNNSSTNAGLVPLKVHCALVVDKKDYHFLNCPLLFILEQKLICQTLL